MDTPSKHRARSLLMLGVALCVVVALTRVPAAAGTGELLRTVTVGAEADCGSQEGTSIALVQGSKVGFPEHPVLLVTSCLASGGGASAKDKRATLYFLNPADPLVDPIASGSVVKTIKTKIGSAITAPGLGWAQLALAPDKGVLLGCGTEGSLYTIDFSTLNSIADGTTTVVPKPAGATNCVGLAWDPSNNSIYQAAGGTIFHFTLTGGAVTGNPASFAPPAGCVVSGLSVVGGVLLVTCDGSATVRRLDKSTGAPLPAYPAFASTAFDDLECDPVTFAAGNIEAVWSKHAATERVQAFRVPAGTCGLPPKATVLEPAACPPEYLNADGSPKDTDGDGLWDCWEDGARWPDGLPGIDFDGDGIRDLILCVTVDTNGDGVPDTTECANPLVKDIFVEIDYMQDANGSKSHKPDPLALLAVRNAFANAPALPGGPGPIRLHIVVDEAMPHVDALAFEPCTGPATAGVADFDVLKDSFFGTNAERANANALKITNAKRLAFRYMIFGHNLLGTSSSGCAEVVGDDAVISLASFGVPDATGHKVQTTDQQAGTVMHELGHLLGLRHGGDDNVGCKPNYLSVMNYSLQFSDFVGNRPLDYSRSELPTLNEAALNELTGIGNVTAFSISGRKTVYGGPTSSIVITLQGQASAGASCPANVPGQSLVSDGPIDWNCNQDPANPAIAANINRHIAAGCDGSGTVLNGFNDWLNLQLNARASLDFAGGVQEFGDKSADQEQASFDGADRDGNGQGDVFGCGSATVRCTIDIKPNENPNVVNLGQESNISVAILSTATFDATRDVVRNTLTLNDMLVKVNQQDQGACHEQDTNRDGRPDLVCQFPSIGLVVGRNFAIVEGQTIVGGVARAFRARDFITVVK